MARRVGSASAEKTRFNSADRELSTIRLNIRQANFGCQMLLCQKIVAGECGWDE